MKKNKLTSSKLFNKTTSFLSYHKGIIIVMILLVIIRLMATYELGIEYNLNSDDLSYVYSGFYFAENGTITMHNEYPSAQIMPGMTVLIGALSLIFGQGKLLWIVLKGMWLAMSVLTAWYIYRCVCLFAPRWCGVMAAIPLMRPDYAWLDNLILTETPFLLCLVGMVYYTLKMGKENKGYKNFWFCALFYMCALMLKANIAPYPVFALVYLLIVKYDKKLLWKQCVILACAVLCFIIPWSVRNYIQFNAFIPLTYGAGNPTLLGTYQGRGYPYDENLDYQTNVMDVLEEEYAEYYDEDGNVKPEYVRYVALQRDGIKSSYRQREWIKRDIRGFLYSLLVQKPQQIMNSIYYMKPILNIESDLLYKLPYVEIFLCIASVVASLILKKCRGPILYVLAIYVGNVYIYATTFAFNRYNASLVYLRYIAIGIGLSLFLLLLVKGYESVRNYHKQAELAETEVSVGASNETADN